MCLRDMLCLKLSLMQYKGQPLRYKDGHNKRWCRSMPKPDTYVHSGELKIRSP